MVGAGLRYAEVMSAAAYYRVLSQCALLVVGLGLLALVVSVRPARANMYDPLLVGLVVVTAGLTASWGRHYQARRLWRDAATAPAGVTPVPVPHRLALRGLGTMGVLTGALLAAAASVGGRGAGGAILLGLSAGAGQLLGTSRGIATRERRSGTLLLVEVHWGIWGHRTEFFTTPASARPGGTVASEVV
ncbi:MAG: hypothetical protein WBU92_08750 [Candidatus Dormiibacterota bacterium]